MSWLAFLFSLELGFLPLGDFVMYQEPAWYESTASFYTQLDVEVVIMDLMFIGGGIWTGLWYNGHGYTFWPHRALYEFRTGIRWKLLELGFRHYCNHPVVPFMPITIPEAIWEGAYEELYLRVSNR